MKPERRTPDKPAYWDKARRALSRRDPVMAATWYLWRSMDPVPVEY